MKRIHYQISQYVIYFAFIFNACEELPYKLTVKKTGSGTGYIQVSGETSSCSDECSYSFKPDEEVTLTASAGYNSTFQGFSGDMVSNETSISFKMEKDLLIEAYFRSNSAQTCTLTINKTGTGSGTVTSSPSGIDCGSSCTAIFEKNAIITLTAAPTGSYTFGGWSRDASGTNGNIQITMSTNKTVYAQFNNPNVVSYILTVNKTGYGSISSSPSGINCGSSCSAAFAQGTNVTLTASPSSGYQFNGWGGDASGTTIMTSIVINANKNVTATFSEIPPLLYDDFSVHPTSYGWNYGPNSTSGSSVNISNGFLQVGSYGSGSDWHGPVIIKSLSQEIDVNNEDFKLEVYMVGSYTSNRYGIIHVGLLENTNSHILGAEWGFVPDFQDKKLRLSLPDGSYANKWPAFSSIGGKVSIKKLSGVLSLHFDDGNALASSNITTNKIASKVFIKFLAYGTNPACEVMKIDWLRAKKGT